MKWSANIAKAAVLAGLVVFIWGMFSWMVLPFHKNMVNKFTSESQVTSVLRSNAPVSGCYVLPDACHAEPGRDMTMAKQQMKNGPVMFAHVKLDGMDYSTPAPYVCAVILQIIGAYLIVCLLMHTRPMKFMNRVGFVTMVGLIVGLLGVVPSWIWMGNTAGGVLLCVVDLVIAWFLGGLVIAKFIHNK